MDLSIYALYFLSSIKQLVSSIVSIALNIYDSHSIKTKHPTKILSVMPTIYSIGSSTRQIEEFIELLHHFQIKILVDVRSFPKSRFNHFIKETLDRELSDAGIDYQYLGKELGGYRKGGYENYTLTTRYEKGVGHLEAIGEKDTTAFMCAERLPWKCHRKFIALTLQERGWNVLHIIDKKRVWEPTQLSLFHRKERTV